MTPAVLDVILNERLDKIRSVLASKADEYAAADRLHNFKRAAAMIGGTPAQACVGFLVKHLVSLFDLVDDDAKGRKDRIQKHLDEKVGDCGAYLVLLEAILSEGFMEIESA